MDEHETNQMAEQITRLQLENADLRDALRPMLQYAVLCYREGKKEGLGEATLRIAERDLERATRALDNA